MDWLLFGWIEVNKHFRRGDDTGNYFDDVKVLRFRSQRVVKCIHLIISDHFYSFDYFCSLSPSIRLHNTNRLELILLCVNENNVLSRRKRTRVTEILRSMQWNCLYRTTAFNIKVNQLCEPNNCVIKNKSLSRRKIRDASNALFASCLQLKLNRTVSSRIGTRRRESFEVSFGNRNSRQHKVSQSELTNRIYGSRKWIAKWDFVFRFLRFVARQRSVS